MRRCVIICGAEIKNYESIRNRLADNDYVICCDSGLRHAAPLGIKPALIIGDFDSFAKPETDTELLVLPCEKDDTDSIFAVKEAIRRGFSEVLILGAVGGRFDHSLANVSALIMLHRHGIRGIIVDDYSCMEIAADTPVEIDESCSYFSLLSIDGTAEGVCIENAKYPLHDAVISADYQYGVSNEVTPGSRARVCVGKGILLLIRVYRDAAQ